MGPYTLKKEAKISRGFWEESLIRKKGSALLSQAVGGRIEFARVVGADRSCGGSVLSTNAGQEAVKDGSHNVVAFSSANVYIVLIGCDRSKYHTGN